MLLERLGQQDRLRKEDVEKKEGSPDPQQKQMLPGLAQVRAYRTKAREGRRRQIQTTVKQQSTNNDTNSRQGKTVHFLTYFLEAQQMPAEGAAAAAWGICEQIS